MFIEITDVKEIRQAQEKLKKHLEKRFPHIRKRVVGWPAGSFKGDVRFASNKNTDSTWWHSWPSKNGKCIYNLFGRGNPAEKSSLSIDLQFNVPVKKFTRSYGGAFLRDVESGEIVLGHRGIVTRGRSRVNRKALLQELRELDVVPEKVTTGKSDKIINILLVTTIDDKKVADRITDFSEVVRSAADVAVNSKGMESELGQKRKTETRRKKASKVDAALKAYFEEFSGKTSYRRKQEVEMHCRHGKVVTALREDTAGEGDHYKSQEMDLVLERRNEVALYEVKTSARSQSIYTAIGQLYIHAATLARLFPEKRITKHLVIPYVPTASHRETICRELGINIISFKLSGENVQILS